MSRTNVAGHVTLKNPVQLMAFHNTHCSTGYQQKKLNKGCEGFKKVPKRDLKSKLESMNPWCGRYSWRKTKENKNTKLWNNKENNKNNRFMKLCFSCEVSCVFHYRIEPVNSIKTDHLSGVMIHSQNNIFCKLWDCLLNEKICYSSY